MGAQTEAVLDEHRWTILGMVEQGKTADEIAEVLGCTRNLVTRAVQRIGAKLQRPLNGPYWTDERLAAVRRHWPKIVEMREAGLTYQKIADAFGISRERVRQVLHQAGRGDLTNHNSNNRARLKPKLICSSCGEEFEPRAATKFQAFCSQECRQTHRTRIFYERDLPRAKRIVDLREQGRRWIDVAVYTGFNGQHQCELWLLRFAEKHARADLLGRAQGSHGTPEPPEQRKAV